MNSKLERFRSLDTKLIHAGEPEPRLFGAVNVPIFQSAMFEYSGESDDHQLRYIRLNNTPNHLAVHEKLAALEGGEAALVTSSGMAAISTTMLTLLKAGDHLLAQRGLYGGTHTFVSQDLESFGISHDFIDADDPSSWKEKVTPRTKAIYVETMTNPLLDVADLEEVTHFARSFGLVSIIDNTFASPVNFRPIEHGFDLSLHSCTKYLNGHSDIVAGAVIGRRALVHSIKHRLDHLGGSLDPHAIFLLHRGMKTLALRVRHQNEAALKISSWLQGQPGVQRSIYPGLESHARHDRAKRLFSGCGGVFCIELTGGESAAIRFIEATRIPIRAPSLGGVETLITRPTTTSHRDILPEERQSLGISDGLIRLSVGIEAPDDLIEDFDHALRDL